MILWCDVDILYENTHVLKNKQVSTFLGENLISMNSRSHEVFGQNCDLIHLFSLTQIDLDIGTTITGMMFHHRPMIWEPTRAMRCSAVMAHDEKAVLAKKFHYTS